MMRHWFVGDDEGAAAVETGIVLPIVILMIFAIIEFGILFSRVQGMQASARETARLGSLVGVTLDDIQARSVDAAPPFVKASDLQLTVTRISILADGSEVVEPSPAWEWEPATATWSGGVGTDVPCDGAIAPDPSDPPAATDVVSIDVHIEMELLNPDNYGVAIPLFGGFAFAHPSIGEARCEF